jgi:hypothetical protein
MPPSQKHITASSLFTKGALFLATALKKEQIVKAGTLAVLGEGDRAKPSAVSPAEACANAGRLRY